MLAMPAARRAMLAAAIVLALPASFSHAQTACSTHWDVVSSITSETDWGALQFDIGYSGSTGRFSGTGSAVRCTNLVSSALFAPSDLDQSAPRILRQGWIAFSSRPAPAALSRCTFLASGSVSPSDFSVTVTAHNDAAGNPIPVTIDLTATCSLCGNGVLDGGEACDPRIAGQECCNADNCSAIVPGCNLCGNGIVNTGEQCDDHETMSGDCCSSSCQFESSVSPCGNPATTSCDLADTCDGAGMCRSNTLADGTPCAGDLCHADSTCTAGMCPEGPPLCDDWNPCTRDDCELDTGACFYTAAPATGCLTAGNSSLLLATARNGKALWKWGDGQATSCDELAAPDSETDYDLCVYDSTGTDQFVLASGFHLPATAIWNVHETGENCSWNYKDKTRATDGIKRLSLESGPESRSSIALSALGSETPIPTPVSSERFLNFHSSVVVQLFNGTGTCWESTFTDASKNDSKKFKASVR